VGTPTCLHLFYPVLRFTSQLSFLCPNIHPHTDPDYRCLTIMAPVVLPTISPLHVRATLPFAQTALSYLRSSRPITDPFISTNHKPAYSDQSQSDQTPKDLYIKRAIKTAHSFIHSFPHPLIKQKTHQGETTPDYHRWSTVVIYHSNPMVYLRSIHAIVIIFEDFASFPATQHSHYTISIDLYYMPAN
jgi:hypothetical protein